MTSTSLNSDEGSPLFYNMTSSGPSSISSNAADDEVLLSADVYLRALPVLDRMLIVLQVTGLILNVLNILVLTRPSMRSPTSAFLVAQSVLQLLYVTLRPLPALQRVFPALRIPPLLYLLHGVYVINYALACLRRSMYCLQCLLSLERLLAVWTPLTARQFLLVRKPWLFILPTPVLVFLLHLHITFQLEVFERAGGGNDTTVYSFRYTQHYRRYPYIFDALGIVMKVIFAYLTLLMLVVVNLVVLGVLKRSASVRRGMKTNVNVDAAERRQRQMTVTILVSTLIFVLLCLPTASNSLATNAAPQSYGPFSKQRYLFLFINSVGVLLFFLAFSTDVFTYVSLSSAYRNTLLRMLKVNRKETSSASMKTCPEKDSVLRSSSGQL